MNLLNMNSGPESFFGGNWVPWINTISFKMNVLNRHNKFFHCLNRDNVNGSLRLVTLTYGYP